MGKKGNRVVCVWVCEETKAHNYVGTYNKKQNAETVKEKMKYCKSLRKRTLHKRKDSKS